MIPTAEPRSGLRQLACGLLGAAALAANTASAFTAEIADAVYQGFLDAYLVTERRADNDGNLLNDPLPYLRGSTTNNKQFAMWEEGFCITGIADAYDSTCDPSRRELLRDLLNAYLDKNGSPLESGWNDDIMWGTRALARGYQITGETRFLDAAIASWFKVWDRAKRDDEWNGGLRIRQTDTSPKCTLVNATFVINGCLLHSATGEAVYLDHAKEIYAWMRLHLFYPSNGQVIECAGTPSDNIYNHGSFIQAANGLYQLTGDEQYFDDALAAIEHIRGQHYIFTTSNGCEEFVRGLSYFARMNGLWDVYYPWLKANAEASWNNRRTDYNISWYDWNDPSPIENLKSMKAIGSLVIQQVTVIRPVGQSELKNSASNLSLSVEGNSTANNAKVVQTSYDGNPSSIWTFNHHPDSGYCEMVNVESGRDAVVQSASTANGAKIIQHGFGPSSNDLWVPALTIRGNYSFVNKKSKKMLGVPAADFAQGTQMEQRTNNRSNEQRWEVVQRGSASTNPLPAVSSGTLFLRLSADDLTLGNGGTVSRWTDSVSGRVFSGAATYGTNYANGHAGVRFNGTSDMLGSTNMTGAPDLANATLFIAGSFTSAGNDGTSDFLISGQYPSGSNNNRLRIYKDGGGNILARMGGGGTIGGVAADAGFHVFSLVSGRTTGAVSHVMDGQQIGSGSSGTPEPMQALFLGANGGGPSLFADCTIGEVLFYDGALSAADSAAVQDYLTRKYSGHAFDSDGDGLPDSWEMAHFGSLTSTSGSTTDSDGDGIADRQEWTTGTDPRNPLSTFKATVGNSTPNLLQVGFDAFPERRYTVETSTNMIDWVRYDSVGPLLPGESRAFQFNIPTTKGAEFVRVRLDKE